LNLLISPVRYHNIFHSVFSEVSRLWAALRLDSAEPRGAPASPCPVFSHFKFRPKPEPPSALLFSPSAISHQVHLLPNSKPPNLLLLNISIIFSPCQVRSHQSTSPRFEPAAASTLETTPCPRPQLSSMPS
jgi:hypothetical protein